MRRITIYALGFPESIVTAIPASAQMYYGPGYGAYLLSRLRAPTFTLLCSAEVTLAAIKAASSSAQRWHLLVLILVSQCKAVSANHTVVIENLKRSFPESVAADDHQNERTPPHAISTAPRKDCAERTFPERSWLGRAACSDPLRPQLKFWHRIIRLARQNIEFRTRPGWD